MPSHPVRATVCAALLLAVAVPATAPAVSAAPQPDPNPAAPAATSRRVLPLPAGNISWGTAYGTAGSMWSSGYHTGQDFPAASGTRILAAADGIVVSTGPGGAYGNLTEIRHADGTQTWYAHQSRILTHTGATVTAGETIGLVGSTGNSTGPHLHFEVRVNGRTVDPRPWLAGRPAVPGTDPATGIGPVADPLAAEQARAAVDAADAAADRARETATQAQHAAATAAETATRARSERERLQSVLNEFARRAFIANVDPGSMAEVDILTAGDPGNAMQAQLLAELVGTRGSTAVDDAEATIARDQAAAVSAATAAQAAQTALAAAEDAARKAEETWAHARDSIAATGFDGTIPDGGGPAAQAAVRYALAQVGKPYVLGTEGPSTFDCSGLVWDAWHRNGSKWPRMVADDQARDRAWTVPVPPGQEQPGDLVFWRLEGATEPISHIALVVNPATGLFVHAANPRVGVTTNNYRTVDYYTSITGFARVVH